MQAGVQDIERQVLSKYLSVRVVWHPASKSAELSTCTCPAEVVEQQSSDNFTLSSFGSPEFTLLHSSNTVPKFSASVLIFIPVSGISTSLPLAGLPASPFMLRGTTSLVSSSSAFLLPFPLPLASVGAEGCCERADPVAAGQRNTEEMQPDREEVKDDKVKTHRRTAHFLLVIGFPAFLGIAVVFSGSFSPFSSSSSSPSALKGNKSLSLWPPL